MHSEPARTGPLSRWFNKKQPWQICVSDQAKAAKVPTVDPKGIATAISLADDPKAASLKPEDLIDNSILESLQQ